VVVNCGPRITRITRIGDLAANDHHASRPHPYFLMVVWRTGTAVAMNPTKKHAAYPSLTGGRTAAISSASRVPPFPPQGC